ncbi:MAG: dihydroorotate dehydrogenase [Planctomycetota bacterium]
MGSVLRGLPAEGRVVLTGERSELGRAEAPGSAGPTVDLSIRIDGPNRSLQLAHPILPASGTFGYGREFEPFVPPGTFAAVVGKSISREPRPGNPPQRTVETPAGLLNSIGLQNPGLERFLAEYLPRLAAYGAPVVVNIVGNRIEDYSYLAERLDAEPAVHALELNVSCPNVTAGLRFGLDPRATRQLLEAVRPCTGLPLIAKLTPNVTDIAEQARAAEDGGADALSLINTLRAMALDWRTRRSRIGRATGGLSGPAIRPIALRMVWEASTAVKIPVCGIGGVTAPEHVLEFMVAGAHAVQVGTHLYREPACLPQWLEQIRTWLAEEGIFRVADLVGTFQPDG